MLDKHQADNYKWLCNTELKDTIDGMLSKDYKERFIAEYKQLVIRLDKLENVISKAKNNSLEFKLSCPRIVLETQAIYMQNYADILRMRARQEGIDID